MLPTETFVELSRWQFALTAMYHFIFVPLTLGLSWILFIMESVYVMTGKEVYKDMTRFWGKLFAINFAIGVTPESPWNSSSAQTGHITPITLETFSVPPWRSRA